MPCVSLHYATRLNLGVRPLSVLHSKIVLSVVSSAGFRPAPAVASLSIALPASLRWPLHRSLPVSALRSTAGFGWPASPSGSPGPGADTRPQLGLVASPRPSCCSVSAQGLGCRGSGASAGRRRPNKSFKPNPLRYAKHMAGKACHVFRSTTLLGLTLVLAPNGEFACFRGFKFAPL